MLNTLEKSWLSTRLDKIRDWENNSPYQDFIDDEKIWNLIHQNSDPDAHQVLDIIAKARENAVHGTMLKPAEVAVLLNTRDLQLWDAIFETADWIKKQVYGNRIVLFAPLYLSNACVNNCAYCGFRQSNRNLERKILTSEELTTEIEALINAGHKRLIAVYGEHPESGADFICKTVEQIYSIRKGFGEIRRCNINAAPLFTEEYERVKEVGIGTYQIFQETYHHQTYQSLHPRNTLKHPYTWRLFGLHRAFKAGIDDVALGVLFGLYDWRFEVLGLLYHAMSLEREFGVGPHTISYPRLVAAENAPMTTNSHYLVSDEDWVLA